MDTHYAELCQLLNTREIIRFQLTVNEAQLQRGLRDFNITEPEVRRLMRPKSKIQNHSAEIK